jgi:hypothetical protein
MLPYKPANFRRGSMESIPTFEMPAEAGLDYIMTIYQLAIQCGLARRFAGIKIRLNESLRSRLVAGTLEELLAKLSTARVKSTVPVKLVLSNCRSVSIPY